MGTCVSTPSQAENIQGNKKDATAFMRIQYCGGWGYLKYANELIQDVE